MRSEAAELSQLLMGFPPAFAYLNLLPIRTHARIFRFFFYF